MCSVAMRGELERKKHFHQRQHTDKGSKRRHGDKCVALRMHTWSHSSYALFLNMATGFKSLSTILHAILVYATENRWVFSVWLHHAEYNVSSRKKKPESYFRSDLFGICVDNERKTS